MGQLLDPRVAERLAKVCSLFSSGYAGERATAAAVADEIIRKHGLTWPEIIRPRDVALTAATEKIAFCLANIDACSMWERGFLYEVNRRRSLSPKQLKILDEIVGKALAHAGAES